MDVRHLRYFIAVAEEGSLLTAAERRLNTSQPNLSRQVRGLEAEVGATLFDRHARGVELTPAGRIFLVHARLALAQVDAAVQGARQMASPARPIFSLGFLASREPWLPHAMRLLREEAPNAEIRLSSHSSPELGLALTRGDLDVAIMRRETRFPGLRFMSLCEEPLVALLAADHPLACRAAISPRDLATEVYVGSAKAAPVLNGILKEYAAKNGITLEPRFEAGSLSAAISMVVSTKGITLIPYHARPLLTSVVVTRPLVGTPPTMELTLGYSGANDAPLLRRFLGRADEFAARFKD